MKTKRSRIVPHDDDLLCVALFILLLMLISLTCSCSTVPFTGRQQLSLVSSEELFALSFKEYDTFIAEHKVVHGTAESRMVNNVGVRIKNAVQDYLTRNNQSHIIEGYQWEFNLVEDKSVNAWALPGGKVAVYTGIMPVAQNETGLAVIMGHEIAHAIAGHGNERMSQQMLAQLGGAALSEALAQNPGATQQIFMTVFGLGTQVGILLPYGRMQESEADQLGLIFMAMAGYDPRQALDFWQRMAAKEEGTVPEFLSTHPATQTRINDLRKFIPTALHYYHQ